MESTLGVKASIECYERALDQASESAELVDNNLVTKFQVLLALLLKCEACGIDQVRRLRATSAKGMGLEESQIVRTKGILSNVLHGKKHKVSLKYPTQLFSIYRGLRLIDTFGSKPRNTPIPMHYTLPTSLQQSLMQTETSKQPRNSGANQSYSTGISLESDYWGGTLSMGFKAINRDIQDLEKDIKTFGNRGNAPGEFLYIRGIAVHPQTGDIYAAEEDNHRVQVFSSDLKLVTVIDSPKDELKNPWCVTISADGSRIAVITMNKIITVFDSQHKFLHTIGPKISEGHSLTTSRNAAYDAQNILYVTDEAGYIFAIDPDGKLCRIIGAPTSPRPVVKPYGIGVSHTNELFVLSKGANEVQVYHTDGTFSRCIDITPLHPSWSHTICRGPDGGFVVSNYGNDSINFYNSEGELLHTLTVKDTLAICFGPDGRFYTGCCGSHVIRIF